MESAYYLREKRRKKRNNAISFLIQAAVEIFLYFLLEEPIRESLGRKGAESFQSFLLFCCVVDIILSLVLFYQMTACDAEIEHAVAAERQRKQMEIERKAKHLEKANVAAAEAIVATANASVVFCTQCRRQLPPKAIYCASCGHKLR